MFKAFAVLDVKASAYGMPMFMSTRGLALRGFADACADSRSMLAQHPEDYQLFEIGEYDQNNGRLNSLEQPELVATASQVVAQLQLARQRPVELPEAEKAGEVSK